MSKTKYYSFCPSCPTFLLCTANEWCGHCKRAEPEFKKLKQLNTAIHVQQLDDKYAGDKQKMKMLKIQGYPSILAVLPLANHPTERGKTVVVRYQGERTADAMSKWILSSNRPDAKLNMPLWEHDPDLIINLRRKK